MAIQQGWNQFTAAARSIIGQGLGARGMRSGTTRRKRKARGKTVGTRKKRRVARKGKRAARLVAGSAAAKAWGRKMKRLRKR